MTIRFTCPRCGALIAFADKHAGKRARCTACNQAFIIPHEDNEPAKPIQPAPAAAEPLPGFYRAVFVDSWKLFFRTENASGLVFVAAAVGFKFFIGHVDYSFTIGYFRVQAFVGQVVTVAAWGCLFWYYMEIIRATAFDVDTLPDVYMGGLFGFIWNIIKSVWLFAVTLLVVLLPCIITIILIGRRGPVGSTFALVLSLTGLFLFPIGILTISVGEELGMVLRPDYLLKPVLRAFRPYTTAAAVFIAVWQLELHTVGYGQLPRCTTGLVAWHFLANVGVQWLAVVAMRCIGLFARHYSCYFPW